VKKHIWTAIALIAVFSSISGAANGASEMVGWGDNSYGQAGVPIVNILFTSVSGGYYHSLGLQQDRSIAAIGRNDYGQCNVPVPNADFNAIAAGGRHSMGLKLDGSIVAWGYNNYGQCDVPAPNTGFVAIAAGYSHSLGLKADGSIVAWGRNDYGQCDVPAPNSGFIAVAAGSYHSLGLKWNGKIVAWGYNAYGQCSVPTPNSGFKAVEGGAYHSLGLKQDGSVAAWGNNGMGQCTVPAPNSGFIAVSGGAYHSMGLKSDGSVVAWGYNGSGQCTVPSPNSGFTAISAGGEHSLAVRTFILNVYDGGVDYFMDGQEIEGFGGAAVYEPADLMNRPYTQEVCDMLFRDLGLDVLRIRNTYGYPDGGYNFNATGQVVAAAKQRNPALKLELVPWSPAAYLKSNESINGGGTLGKDINDNYRYDDYAQWWADSLNAFANIGVVPDYISIQNEPDVETDYDSMKFNPVEDSDYAGYNKAFEAVFNKLDGNVSPMPKMIGPETAGYSSGDYDYSPRGARDYIDNLINQNHCYAFSFHPYNDAYGTYGFDNPDFLLDSMEDFGASYGYKPLIMTEFCRLNKTPDFADAVNLGWHIHNFLTYMGVTSYYHWTLFRGYGTGGAINIADPNTYIVRDLYWFLKAYAHFTDPGWIVLESWADSEDLRITAFKNPEETKLTIVILNKSDNTDGVMLDLVDFSPLSSKVYRSSQTEHWRYLGIFNPSQQLICPRKSITTISLSNSISDCDAVLAAGHRLAADIGGAGDCYVNFADFVVLANHWLDTGCAGSGNCDGADFEPNGVVNMFDLSDFANQWLTCNDPTNPNCTPNW